MKSILPCLIAVLALLTTKTVNGQLVPTPSHVVIVIEENHSYSEIIGSSSAPYINSLATDTEGALFTQSFAIEHPSQPNYLDFFSGANQGVIGDLTPFSFLLPFTTANLGAELLQHSRTFTGYSEDLPSVGYTGDNSGAYYRKHNPWVNWQGTGTNGIPTSDNQPFTAFPSNYNNLPTVSFVIPNQNDDMHDGTIAQGDTWLQNNLNSYIQWAKTNNSLFILTFDEDDNGSNNQITTIFVGQMVQSGQYSEHITHYNVLRTIEDMYGLPYAGSSSSATPITDCWVFKPHSGMTATPGSICPGQSVSIQDASTHVPTRWQWTFQGGNPSSSFSQNQTVTYDSAGAYDVTLITSNHMGFDTLHLPGYITVNPIPVLSLNAAPDTLCMGDTVSITALGATAFNWLPGDNVISVSNSILKAAPFLNATYKVLGTANGCVSDTTGISIEVTTPVVPVINIISDAGTKVCTGTTVTFNAAASNGGSTPSYQWKVDGLNTGSGDTMLSTYAVNNFSVECVLTSNALCAKPATVASNVLSISVNPLPQPIVTASDSLLTCTPSASYQWYLNGQAINSATSSTYLADTSGTYYAVVVDSNGCSGTSNSVTIDLTITSITDLKDNQSLKVYVNALGSSSWELEVGSSFIGGEAEVFDASGRVVFKSLIVNRSSLISADFPRGIYLLRISSGKSSVVMKLVRM